jgi:hypothetical protein
MRTLTSSSSGGECCNPTLAKCGGEAQHLEKVRIWSPPRLPNVQSSTKRGKTPRLGVFLASLNMQQPPYGSGAYSPLVF